MRKFFQTYGLFVTFVVMFIVLAIWSPAFRSSQNMLNLLQQNAVNGIIACGMTLMMISGGFDLSVGANAALSGMVGAALMLKFSIPMGMLGGILASTAVGLINGLLIAKAGINPFVTTLGTQIITRGLIYVPRTLSPSTGFPFPT